MGGLDVSSIKSMRDINDYCVANGLLSLAQGMIELPPPHALRNVFTPQVFAEDAVHCYRARKGEAEYLAAMEGVLKAEGVTAPLDGAILATQGVTGALISSFIHIRAALGRAPQFALIEPFYTYHKVQIQSITGVAPICVKGVEQDPEGLPGVQFGFSLENLEAVMDRVDAVIFCSPHNPTGRLWSMDEVTSVYNCVVKKHGKFLVADECYSDMVHGGQPFPSIIQKVIDPKVIVCRGFSKTLGCQSWRVGYAVSAPDTIASMCALGDPIYICTPIMQHSIARFVRDDAEGYAKHKADLCALLQENWAVLKAAFLKRFPEWKAIDPQATMYGNFRHNLASDLEATTACLDLGVGVCPGSMFVEEGITATAQTHTIRIHCGISPEKARLVAAALTGA
eukprot:TRINITY_DN1509_c0_g1_i3.p1 TRINITY_DN1509_c0_g1~~TRINITY_DN1509_c0_g1_i3.p1  ORF type:complete len:414 (+),score=165.16 TRINITY_DN1509_c0_g1_i3:56-1243(+)